MLTPGYIIVDTRNVDAFEAQLQGVPAFMRLLGGDDGFKPLGREADIVRFNRRKRKATALMAFMGRPKEIELELEIVGKTSE